MQRDEGIRRSSTSIKLYMRQAHALRHRKNLKVMIITKSITIPTPTTLLFHCQPWPTLPPVKRLVP